MAYTMYFFDLCNFSYYYIWNSKNTGFEKNRGLKYTINFG